MKTKSTKERRQPEEGLLEEYIASYGLSISNYDVDSTSNTLSDDILRNKYLAPMDVNDKTGNPNKLKMWSRIAYAVSSVEDTISKADEWYSKFMDILVDFKFVPGGRVIHAAGRSDAKRKPTLANCYVIGIASKLRSGISKPLAEFVVLVADKLWEPDKAKNYIIEKYPYVALAKLIDPAQYGINTITGRMSIIAFLEDLTRPTKTEKEDLITALIEACCEYPADSVEAGYKWLEESAKAYRTGAGVGTEVGVFRPKGAVVNASIKEAPGATWLMHLMSESTNCISQNCLVGGTRIATNKGLIKIGDIRPLNHLAQTPHGYREIPELFDNGVGDIVKVTLTNGLNLSVTPNHKFACLDKINPFGYKMIEAADLSKNDLMLLSIGAGSEIVDYQDLSTPVITDHGNRLDKSVKTPLVLNEDVAYFLGYLFANGHTTEKNYDVSLSVPNSRPEVIRHLKDLHQKLFGKYYENPGDGDCVAVGIRSRIVYEWLQTNGLAKDYAHNSVLPELIWTSKDTVQWSFIAGYFDADGNDSGRKKGKAISSVNRQMLEDLLVILIFHGIPGKIGTEDRSSIGWQDLHTLCITGRTPKKRWDLKIGLYSLKNRCGVYHKDYNRDTFPKDWFNKIGVEHRYERGRYNGGGNGISFSTLCDIVEVAGDVYAPLRNVYPTRVSRVVPDGKDRVYDIEVNEQHVLSANGVLTSNSRRGALMITIPISHPDIEEFITIKSDHGRTRVQYANISVKVTDDFMEALENDNDYDLRWRGKVYKTVKAKELWKKIIEHAHASAEPGILFWDKMVEYHNLERLGMPLVSTNPCGEQPLAHYTSCNLGHVNLVKHIDKETLNLNAGDLDNTVSIAVRFLDNVVTYNAPNHALQEITDATLQDRRVGLGILGLGDALIEVGLKYDTEQAIEYAEDIADLIKRAAYHASVDLATERQSFPAYDFEGYSKSAFFKELPSEIRTRIEMEGIRNGTILTIAPTGTISIVAEVSSGIEPVFASWIKRRVKQEDGLTFKDYIVSAPIVNRLFDGDRTNLPEHFVVSHEINAKMRVKMQAAWQKHIDSSISSTVNLPKDIAVETVMTIYEEAYRSGLKGITVYREGSREGILQTIDEEEKGRTSEETKLHRPSHRPEVLTGNTFKIPIGPRKLFITINRDETGKLIEVIGNLGKSGGDDAAHIASICRLVSIALRAQIDPMEIIEQLENQGGSDFSRFMFPGERKSTLILSAPDAIAKALRHELGKGNGKTDIAVTAEIAQALLRQEEEEISEETGEYCPACEDPQGLINDSGCIICKNCGDTKCN